MFRNVICFMLYEDKKFNFSQDRNFFFSHVLHVYISFIFVLYCVKPFVSVYFCHKYTYIPTRLDAAPGGRSARAPRSAGGPAGDRSARARALQTRGHPYQAWRRAGWQPAPPSTNLGVTGHPGPAAEARLVMKKKWAHIYTRLDAAPAGRLVVCRPMAIRCTRLGAGRAGSQPAPTYE